MCVCMIVCTYVCVLHKDTWLRPLLFLPPTSHTQSVNPSCCLILKKPTTHSHTYTHSSEANMTKVDSRKLNDGSLKSPRGSWWSMLQLPVTQPCRTEWPKWPPGVTATVTKLNVLLSILQFSVVSLARSLSFSSSFTASIWTLQWNLSTTQHGGADIISVGLFCSKGNVMTESTSALSFCTNFCSSLPSWVALQALWSCLSLFFLSPLLLFFFNLLWVDF